MQCFTDLYVSLDETTKTNAKLAAMEHYFAAAPPEDAAWAIFFLSGRKINRLLKNALLWRWGVELAQLPDWLFRECYDAVGDFAETLALLLPPPNESTQRSLHDWVENDLLRLKSASEQEQREIIERAWKSMDQPQRFVWNKLITGEFRVGVSQRLVTRALGQVSGIDDKAIAHRLMGHWWPSANFYTALLSPDTEDTESSRPYPFFLAYPLAENPSILGAREQWQVEWKWDGIRAQLIRRKSHSYLWSRGEELITERFPEVHAASHQLPNGVALDGELLGWKDGQVLPFSHLQRRIGRKTLGKKILSDVPVVFLAYDLIEFDGKDIRERPLQERRQLLDKLIAALNHPQLLISPVLPEDSWEALGESRRASRERNVEGLMIKRLDAPYRVGRQRGDWWKWKIDPYSIDCVLLYAQRGHGRRASLYTDYTFGVWSGDELVPFAKAYSGLTDEEIRKVDAFVRRNTLEKFGPVRQVKPELVFELGFEGISRSTRHKSGIAVRFPRMLNWRTDKLPKDADTLETIQALLPDDAA